MTQSITIRLTSIRKRLLKLFSAYGHLSLAKKTAGLIGKEEDKLR